MTALTVSACGGSDPSGAATVESPEGCADVESVVITPDGDGTFRFDVAVASADTGEDKYADRWEIRTPGGEVIATRELLHPHVDEQPFTRSLGGVAVPPSTESVVVAAHDSVLGFCGQTRSVVVPPP